ncbi:unnamed protein product [Diatraea saccharalis]|uniref:Peptidase S1 domain-containing protein n=1 Tax=Diatraea saccharalis TaxID=40085 RepID=A0A9N9R525_9NEOP|nr:unnamed protein product [Diatraea saccharalis]
MRLLFMSIFVVASMTVSAEIDKDISSLFEPTTVKIYTAATYAPPTSNTTDSSMKLKQACITEDNQAGYCVNRILCKNKTIVTKGTGLKPRSSASPCPLSQVCCAPKSSVNTPAPPVTTAPLIKTSITPSTTTYTKGCGYRGEILSRVSGGDEAQFAEFPWAVPIFKVEDGKEVYVCGGSLIHPRLILTYAIRFTRGGRFVVKPGEYDIHVDSEIAGHQTIEVTKMIPHKNFNSGGMFNNIAILVLKEVVRIDPTSIYNNIGYVCLPTANIRPTPGTKCIVTGWGSANITDVTPRNIPKMLEVPMVAFDVCQSLARMHVRPEYVLHTSLMCFGGNKDEDSCRGDGGSPLVCQYPGENRYYQAGIVSWGPYCGKKDMPSMYTDVAALRPWIDETVRAEGFETSYYTPQATDELKKQY